MKGGGGVRIRKGICVRNNLSSYSQITIANYRQSFLRIDKSILECDFRRRHFIQAVQPERPVFVVLRPERWDPAGGEAVDKPAGATAGPGRARRD